MKSIRDLAIEGRRTFLRVDFNVPLAGGNVMDATRIVETLPTILHAIERGARLVCASHLGKPKGQRKAELSLAPVSLELARQLGRPVLFAEDCIGSDVEKLVAGLEPGDVLLLENLRFHGGEESNDAGFARALAALADVYVNDAFGSSHRAHASVTGVPAFVAEKGAGFLLEKEVRELSRLLDPERPFAAILGGAKISGKIDTLRVLARRADTLLVGGGIANHFVRAIGLPVGRSLVEEDKVSVAREILDFCRANRKEIALPTDFVVAASPEDGAHARTVGIAKIPEDAMALDVGQKTLEQFERLLAPAQTIFWNGPLGVFEKPPFDKGTRALALLLAESDAITVVGGGESVAAVQQAGAADRFTHVSTGGGASLEFLANNGKLPGIDALS
jgi:phosphoglycerate kinase